MNREACQRVSFTIVTTFCSYRFNLINEEACSTKDLTSFFD